MQFKLKNSIQLKKSRKERNRFKVNECEGGNGSSVMLTMKMMTATTTMTTTMTDKRSEEHRGKINWMKCYFFSLFALFSASWHILNRASTIYHTIFAVCLCLYVCVQYEKKVCALSKLIHENKVLYAAKERKLMAIVDSSTNRCRGKCSNVERIWSSPKKTNAKHSRQEN